MSIIEQVKEHIQNGELVEYLPEYFGSDCHKRGLYLSCELAEELSKPRKKHAQSIALIKATLYRFHTGKPFVNKQDIKQLENDVYHDIWELKIRTPPQYRVFGAFIAPDTLFMNHLYERSKLQNKGDSWRWNKAMHMVDQKWKTLFPEYPRFNAQHFNDYLS